MTSYVSIMGRVLGYDATGLLFQKMPVGIPLAGKGKVFWVDSVSGRSGASGLNPKECLATLMQAYAKCTASQGDTIVCLSSHAENVSDATTNALNKAGITIIGLGQGRLRPTFTVDTANTSTFAVSAANNTIRNCRFIANFLSIAACFTLTTATGFRLEDCFFGDTSGVLDFLNIVKSTGNANTIDGLRVERCRWNSLGTTSMGSLVLSANDIDDCVLMGNYITQVSTVDAAILATISAGVLTNFLAEGNVCYRKNTTTANGSLVNVGGTTSTGFVKGNYVQTLTTTSDKLFTTTVGLAAFENRVTGVVGAQGFAIPAADS